jgi:predicted metal-dependent phosphoesterase TrpH
MIDLQMHSNFSDGSMSPAELVTEAKELGLTAIALTDHDTIDGVPEFIEAGNKYGVTTVPGVEISVDTKMPNNGHMHMVGLFIDPFAKELKETLHYLLTERNLRAQKIIQKLNELDVPITMPELLQEAGEGSIGRPHVAKIMLRKGIVSSIQEAFDIYLAKGQPAYMDKVKLGENDAIDMIKKANGLAILAHPHLMNYDTFDEAKEKILELKRIGLDGFEVYYSGMSEEYTQKLLALAREEHFLISGGSDYHGANKDDIKMGYGKGDLHISDEVHHQLKKNWQSKAQPVTEK